MTILSRTSGVVLFLFSLSLQAGTDQPVGTKAPAKPAQGYQTLLPTSKDGAAPEGLKSTKKAVDIKSNISLTGSCVDAQGLEHAKDTAGFETCMRTKAERPEELRSEEPSEVYGKRPKDKKGAKDPFPNEPKRDSEKAGVELKFGS